MISLHWGYALSATVSSILMKGLQNITHRLQTQALNCIGVVEFVYTQWDKVGHSRDALITQGRAEAQCHTVNASVWN